MIGLKKKEEEEEVVKMVEHVPLIRNAFNYWPSRLFLSFLSLSPPTSNKSAGDTTASFSFFLPAPRSFLSLGRIVQRVERDSMHIESSGDSELAG